MLGTPEPNGIEPEIGEGRALAIASLFVRTYARYRKHEYEALHGASIDIEALIPCDRRTFAITPYESLEPTVPYIRRKAVGSHWIVTFCQRGRPTLSVSVPALSADLDIIDDRLITPPGSGSGLHSFGVPPGHRAVPLSPEAAALHAATMTGRRVSEVPKLILRPGLTVPQSALWLIRLESPVEIRGNQTGESSSSDLMIVGYDFGWTSPTLFRLTRGAGDPPIDSLKFSSDQGAPSAVPLRPKPGMPSGVETATVVQ
jgi:hypothetical protein